MLQQDLAALAAPAIVCVAFLVGAWAIVRKELAPKRRRAALEEPGPDDSEPGAGPADPGRGAN
jgi:hypothetical protein